MSGVTIKDGTGGGYEGKVDINNRLHAYAVTVSEAGQANLDGNAYNVNTGDITLTNATETPILYIKNNEDRDLNIESLILYAGTSTGGTATLGVKWVVVRNPSAGTIISGAAAVDVESNRNYGSNNTVLFDSYKGATGSTMSGGDDHIIVRGATFFRSVIGINEIIPKGSSIGVKVTPPTSNTSMVVYAAAQTHLEG
jgi:hypothetical protein